MSKKQDAAEAADAGDAVGQAGAEHVLATDVYAGKGGSFVFDPASGQRMPAPENDDDEKGAA